MSVLGHFLEEEGLATTLVSLVRLHSEKVRPPRALWVPFELGRPLGPPLDRVLQRRVLESALALLESDKGPCLLVNFDHEGDASEPDANWQAPWSDAPSVDVSDINGAMQALKEEIERLEPVYEKVKAARGSTMGVAKLSIGDIGAHIASFLDGPHENSPREDLSAAMVLRFGTDDLKSFYLETAAANGRPNSWQLGEWFWRNTVAGAILVALRTAAVDSSDKRFRTVGGSFLVPRIWVAELNL